MIKKKPWGTTVCLIDTPMMQLHRIKVDPSSFCSIHEHAGRANVFYVVSGRLIIRVWNKDEHTDVSLLPGEYLSVPPGVRHQFLTRLSQAVALEIYYPVLSLDDIIRYTKGGRKP